jgi:hypothetical protein
MIWESHYWKSDLLRDATTIERWAGKKASDRQAFLLEKKIMLSAYVIRRLFESGKVEDELEESVVDVKCFRSKGTVIYHMNWHHIDRHFDLENSAGEQRRCNFICNQIIHSYVFALVGKPEKTEAFMVSSDKYRRKLLYEVSIKGYCEYLVRVGTSHPSTSRRWYAHDPRDLASPSSASRP